MAAAASPIDVVRLRRGPVSPHTYEVCAGEKAVELSGANAQKVSEREPRGLSEGVSEPRSLSGARYKRATRASIHRPRTQGTSDRVHTCYAYTVRAEKSKRNYRTQGHTNSDFGIEA